MEQSILKSTKKNLNIDMDDTSFDLDVLTHINTAFSNLNDLGVGPDIGFTIEDDETAWSAYLSDKILLPKVKNFIWLSCRLWFDPPTTSFAQAAAERQLEQCGWRLSVNREATDWEDPNPP